MKLMTKRNLIVVAIAAVIIFFTKPVHAEQETYITVGGIVDHIGSDGFIDPISQELTAYNERANDVFGVEVVDKETQYGTGYMSFKNSYYNTGSLVYASKYWELNDNVKLGVLGGVVHGYEDHQMTEHLQLTDKTHAIFAPRLTIKSDKTNLFSSLTLFGNAAVLTFGSKF